MPLINCKINLHLNWSDHCVISSVTGETLFAVTNAKLHVQFVTLSIQDNIKLWKQLESGFERKMNCNKY